MLILFTDTMTKSLEDMLTSRELLFKKKNLENLATKNGNSKLETE